MDCPELSMEEQLELLSNEKKEMLLEKINNEYSAPDVSTYAATWTYLDDFFMYGQINSYYCVVASVKSAMQYITGSSDSQQVIASELGVIQNQGTNINNALTYLNNHQSQRVYVKKSATTASSTMKNNFSSAIQTYDVPPLISVEMIVEEGWDYYSSGHCLCICGMRSDQLFYQIGDPGISLELPGSATKYSKAASVIVEAIQLRGNGYIY